MPEQKLICYTVDLEHDYAGLSSSDKYEAFSHREDLDRLADIVRRFELKLTVFATGKVLTQRKETVKFFQDLGAEIELHGYHHIMYQPDVALEIKKGMEAYRKYFGKNPMGYRSPGGVISPILLKTLASEGIQYDSSLVPSFRWRVYKNLKSPIQPFYHPEAPIFELPIGVVPKIRLPIAASYIRLLGLSTYKLLFGLFGTHSPLVYLFHLVDLIPTEMLKRLSLFWRCVYTKGQKKGVEVFEASVRYFKNMGYKPEFMSNLHKRYSQMPGSLLEKNHFSE
ncbi:MAG: polysaccharide deacetylase family protein [Candidatus Aminicenantes bacterium]|nr:polysaccharide deacetylase family protein [Candidatus Aminicenantes bacterium]MDH5385286.1 polysaccharide deacetylase family protein [Candidatus Aminicenantes bacterium]MDH5742384.1 polysaccharide deacetylase family protein [Candidatus Aminicenantes bacterium]